MAIRGVTVGLYPTNPSAEVEYTLNDCGSVVHLAEDQEQTDKVLELPATTFASLRRVLYIESRGLAEYDDERLLSWEAFLDMGRAHREANPDAVAERMVAAEADDVMTLVYTSGTTGPPKGAMLTNANASFTIDLVIMNPDRFPDGRAPDSRDQIVTYLPLCHVAERLFSTWHLVAARSVLNFAESADQVNVALREIQPTLFFAVPRVWEKLHAGVMIRGGRRVAGQAVHARPGAGSGELDRTPAGGERRTVDAGDPDRLRDRLGVRLPSTAGAPRAALLPLCSLRGGPDRT